MESESIKEFSGALTAIEHGKKEFHEGYLQCYCDYVKKNAKKD